MQPALSRAKQAQLAREVKERIRSQNFEARLGQQFARLTRADRNRIFVKCALRHHITRTRIPRVIFPKGEQGSRKESVTNRREARLPLGRRNMMENAIREGQI
ncbi:MAG: hypothetical protein WCF89_03155, partial [Candidatus Sulfotelmatobacter sp.]